MGRAVSKVAGSRRGTFLRARHLRNLMLALSISAIAILGAGLRTNQLLSEARALTEMMLLGPKIAGRMAQIQMWLEVEDDLTGPGDGALAPLAQRAAIAAQELEALHDRAMQLNWQLGRGGDVSASAAENFDLPAHRIDMMVRSLLRGVARTVDARGSQRIAARRDMRALAEKGLSVAFAEAGRTLAIEEASRRRSARVVALLGALGAATGMMMAVAFHVRGPRRANMALEERIDDSMTRVEEVEVYLRGAERDRARMMDLSAAGLELPAERMRAAASLLARTPLTETQGRVLHGLRQALGEIAGRVEGLRVLARGWQAAPDVAGGAPGRGLCRMAAPGAGARAGRRQAGRGGAGIGPDRRGARRRIDDPPGAGPSAGRRAAPLGQGRAGQHRGAIGNRRAALA